MAMNNPYGGIPASAYFGNGGNGGNAVPFSPEWYAAQGMSPTGQPLPPGGTNTASKTPAQIITDIINNGTAAVPDALKALGSQGTNTSSASAGATPAIQAASDKTADLITNMIGTGIPDYTGQRVTPLSTSEQSSLDQLKQMTQGQGAGTSAMQGAVDQKTAGIQPKQLADVDMSKYVNPALSAEYDAILHGNDVMNNATRARMAKSGAFGENMQVAQAQNNESTQRQLALAGSDAFKTAQAAAQSDVGASNTAAAQNQQAQLTDAQRALAGGQMLTSDQLATNQAQTTAGAAARGVQQSGLDAQWQQYLTKLGLNMQLPGVASSALAGLPGRTFTQTSPGPSPAGQEIGSLIGLTGLQQQYSQYPYGPGGGGAVSGKITGNIPGAVSGVPGAV